MNLPANVSASVKRLNPDIYGLAGLQNPKRKRDQRSQGQNQSMVCGAKSLVYQIAIISCRRRLVDAHDNLRTGAKPLVDAITSTLGFASDSDERLNWEYHQVKSEVEGTAVVIQQHGINARPAAPSSLFHTAAATNGQAEHVCD